MSTFTFGPEALLTGRITPARQPTDFGLVVWGLGLSELRLARRLAGLGVTTLQIRISGPAFEVSDERNAIYDTHGLTLTRAAMERLAEEGVRRFVVMGNCAAACLAFNAARGDSRIRGVVMTNPHFEGIPAPGSIGKALGRAGLWRRVLSGDLRLRRRLQGLVHKLRASRGDARGTARYAGDLYLDRSFERAVRHLAAEGVSLHLACASRDASLATLRREFPSLETAPPPGFDLAVIDSDAHVFDTDEAAIAELNRRIVAWVEKGTLSHGAFASGAGSPIEFCAPEAELTGPTGG